MWLRRTKSRSRVHNAPAPSPKFGCSSFKDAHILLSDDAAAAAAAGGGNSYESSPAGKPPIFHRSRSCNNLLRTLNNPSFLINEPSQTGIRIPGAERCVVLYFTSLRVVRRTFEDCNAVRSLLQCFRVPIDERDISIDSRYVDELKKILGISDKSKLDLPRVFIGGRYVGGVDEVRRLSETGELKKWMEGLPTAKPGTCEACGGMRFVLCQECNGSNKRFSEKGALRNCTLCNEYGLIRCPSCSSVSFI